MGNGTIQGYIPKLIYRLSTSTIGKNILSLYTLQFANYILPLITVPYLVRVLGPEKFGAVAFGQRFIMYFVLLVNYGFDWSATRTISVQRDELQKVSKIASAVLGAKVILTVLSFGILSLLVAMVPKFREMSALLYILFGIVIGNALFPQWLFQGLERMVAISVVNLSMRAVALAGIFVLIHQPADYLKYAGLLGFQWVGAGIVGLIWAWLGLRVKPALPALSEIIRALREGWWLFWSQASLTLFTTGNAFILGILTDYAAVGYYVVGEKVVFTLMGALYTFSVAIYPRFSNMARTSKQLALLWGRRVLLVMGIVGISLAVALEFLAPIIVRVVAGEDYQRSIAVIRALAPLLFIERVVNIWGMQIILPFGHDRAFFLIHSASGFISMALALLLIPNYKEIGTALSVLAAWVSMMLIEVLYLAARVGVTPLLSLRDKSKN